MRNNAQDAQTKKTKPYQRSSQRLYVISMDKERQFVLYDPNPHAMSVRIGRRIDSNKDRKRLKKSGCWRSLSIKQNAHTTTTQQHRPDAFVPVSRLVAPVNHLPVIEFRRAKDIDSTKGILKRQKWRLAFIYGCFNRIGIRQAGELYTVYNTREYYTRCIILSKTQKPEKAVQKPETGRKKAFMSRMPYI